MIAELHGKASSRNPPDERSEDRLTSDVFGTMLYSGWKCGLLDWLKHSEPYSRDKHNIGEDVENSQAVHFCFWPHLPWKGGFREPEWLHIYLTKDCSKPDLGNGIGKGAESLGEDLPVPLFWLSWTWLSSCLTTDHHGLATGQKLQIRDLKELLEKKGLTRFTGFNRSLACSSEWDTAKLTFWKEDLATG